MKILIANDGLHAHYHERLAWTNAFNSIPGVTCGMYDVNIAKAFDIFDIYQPDIYIGQLYNMSKATLKCIQERPHLKVALRTGEWNDEPADEHVLRVTEQELYMLEQMISTCLKPDFIYSHYRQEDIEKTHCKFKEKLGIEVIGIPMSADIHTYGNSKYDKRLACDIGFVGGYWPYKGQIIDQYLTPLCSPEYDYKIKIFGNQPWPHINQYYGLINDNSVADLFKSATICPNLSEPHAHKYGIDVNERAFKVLAAGGFCIMDNIEAAKKIFQDGVVFADSPEHFKEKINYYLDSKNNEERINIAKKGQEIVLKEHTNFHRAELFLKAFNEDSYARQLVQTVSA